MDFSFTTEEEELGDVARRLLRARISTAQLLASVDAGTVFQRALWETAAEAGWTGALVDEAHGGTDAGLVGLALPLVECGAALVPLPLAEALVVFPLLVGRYGTGPQRDRWLPTVVDGRALPTLRVRSARSARGGGESVGRGGGESVGPGGGLVARPDGAGWRVDGVAEAVPFGAHADVAVLAAEMADAPRPTRLFLVEPEDTGVSWQAVGGLDPTGPMARATLRDVRLSADRVLGRADETPAMLELASTAGRIAYALAAVGGMKEVLGRTVAYVTERHQFGKPIGSFQAVKHHAADMRRRLDTAEPAACFAAWTFDHDAAAVRDAALVAYVAAADGFLEVAKTGLQLHGAIGYTWDHGLHLYLRRAQQLAHSAGSTSDACIELGRRARAGRVEALT